MTATRHTEAPSLDTLVCEHIYLVQHIVNDAARRYPRHVDRSELWSAGAAGLVDAASRFDASANVPFARYASIRIRGAIIDSTRARDWATRSLRRRARELRATERHLEQQLARTPSRAELADATGMTVDEVERCQLDIERSTLLGLDQPADTPVSADTDGGTLGSFLREQDTSALPAEATEERELLGTLRVAVANLDEVHREVIVRNFFGDDVLHQIAADLGVTEARVSQIRSEAINAIRAYFGTEFDRVPAVPDSAPGQRRRAAYLSTMRERTDWRHRFDATELTA